MDEKIKTQRKQWQKPELTVLVRSKPEEAVLTTCKLNTNSELTHPSSVATHCSTPLGVCGSQCSSLVGS
jgi:hypothetical protein